MRVISHGRTVAVCILMLLLWSCASAPPRPMTDMRSGSGSNENQFCSWTFDKGPSGKVIADSVRVSNKAGAGCTILHSGNKLFIGDAANNGKEIVDISGAVEFVTKGSCRYCYLNTFGGMTCIVYPGC